MISFASNKTFESITWGRFMAVMVAASGYSGRPGYAGRLYSRLRTEPVAGLRPSGSRSCREKPPGLPSHGGYGKGAEQRQEQMMEDAITIDNRGDFGLWAIEVAKQIVADQGFELARAARDGTEDDVRVAGNALGQAITNAMMEVFDGLMEGVGDEQERA